MAAPAGGPLGDAERKLIARALLQAHGNLSRAAELLGGLRGTLRRRLARA